MSKEIHIPFGPGDFIVYKPETQTYWFKGENFDFTQFQKSFPINQNFERDSIIAEFHSLAVRFAWLYLEDKLTVQFRDDLSKTTEYRHLYFEFVVEVPENDRTLMTCSEFDDID